MGKRLVGGLFLLNLLAISLNLNAGEVDIENEEVLDQLKQLRSFIDEKRDFTKGFKDLKPVLVQYRSSESKIDGIVPCNLSFNTDALHLSIGGKSLQADGSVIDIVINVVFEFEEYVGYKIKSAKLYCSKVETNKVEFVEISGSISESETTIDITEEQYQKLLGSNAILKVNDAENGSLYLYKTNDVQNPVTTIYSNILNNVSFSAVVQQVETEGDPEYAVVITSQALGGGTKLYKHVILDVYTKGGAPAPITLINKSATPITSNFINAFNDSNVVSVRNDTGSVIMFAWSEGQAKYLAYMGGNHSAIEPIAVEITGTTYTDTVTEL